MRKSFYLLLIALSLSTNAAAWDRIPLAVGIIESMPIGHGHGKSPMRPPVVYLEDHTLSFVVDHPDYELTIKDEDGEVVYSTIVTSAETLVTLPSSLAGEYVIELRMGNWLFTGWINLQ
jgi:hypothetical protein